MLLRSKSVGWRPDKRFTRWSFFMFKICLILLFGLGAAFAAPVAPVVPARAKAKAPKIKADKVPKAKIDMPKVEAKAAQTKTEAPKSRAKMPKVEAKKSKAEMPKLKMPKVEAKAKTPMFKAKATKAKATKVKAKIAKIKAKIAKAKAKTAKTKAAKGKAKTAKTAKGKAKIAKAAKGKAKIAKAKVVQVEAPQSLLDTLNDMRILLRAQRHKLFINRYVAPENRASLERVGMEKIIEGFKGKKAEFLLNVLENLEDNSVKIEENIVHFRGANRQIRFKHIDDIWYLMNK